MINNKYKTEIILVFHIFLGYVLSNSSTAATLYALSILAYGLYYVYQSKSRDIAAAFVAAYLVGSEVLLRATAGSLVYEFGKYATILFLIIGLIMQNPGRQKPGIFILFILVLLPSIIVTDYSSFLDARYMLSFNLSGPICLGISAYYFYNRKFSVIQLRKLLLSLLYPIVTMLVVIYIRGGSLDEIAYTTESNFQASGGFGPNQVSTILGLGVLIIALAYFLNIRLFRIKYLDLFFMFAFFIRGLATFSRGGVLAPIIAALFCIVIMTITDKGFQHRITKMAYVFTAIIVVVFFGFNYVNDVSGGLLEMRFKGQSEYTSEKSNLYSGRDEIFFEDMDIFKDNFILGVGPGMAEYYRHDGAAAHIEYSRLLAEHGLFGIAALLILFLVPASRFMKLKNTDDRVILIICVVFTCVTMGHAAMRIAAPGFVYGMAFLNLVRKPRV